MRAVLGGSRTSLLAYDDRTLLLAQPDGRQYALHEHDLGGTGGLAAALQATRRAANEQLGQVAMMLPLGKSVLLDVTIDAKIWTGDALGVAENSIPRNAFKQDADLIVEAADQGRHKGQRHVAAGAIERDALISVMDAVAELDGKVVHAFHPAEALAAALPEAEAIVWLSASYMLFTVVTKDTLLVKLEPRSARQTAWLKAAQEHIGEARAARGPLFARRIVVIGEDVEKDADALAKATNAEILVPKTNTPGGSSPLFWIAVGLDRCAAGKYPRKPVNFATKLNRESEKPAVIGALGGLGAGVVAAVLASWVLHGQVAMRAHSLELAKQNLTELQLQVEEREGHFTADVKTLGDTATQVALARDSGASLAASVEQLGNVALSNGAWMSGTLAYTPDHDPSLAVAVRSATQLGALQLALARDHYNGQWSTWTPVKAGDATYLTVQLGQQQ